MIRSDEIGELVFTPRNETSLLSLVQDFAKDARQARPLDSSFRGRHPAADFS